jgi:trans-aconitate methyltransferase
LKNELVTPDKTWDAALYDDKHSFVWRYGIELIELLAPKPGEKMLDIGCGTAHLTGKIAEFGAVVVGLDNSAAMIEQARKNYPNLRFELADATEFYFDMVFDAVFSNAVLHWIEDQKKLLQCIYKSLKPGGRFVTEFGGKRNTQAIKDALYLAVKSAGYPVTQEAKFRFFPSIGEYATLLEKNGFTVTYARYFERPTPLEGGEAGMKNWLEMFANNVLDNVPPESRSAVTEQVENQLRPQLYRDGQWFADYRRIRAIAFK